MNILAIIPARAGSKGVPNKNIRIVGGHPLVYYSIQNALKSSYITDVIVSTDSPEVRIISNQMGAKCHWRNENLCGDSVTLDAVVADAIPEGTWDYIITMQPTSPTLKVKTLDSAIEYAIHNDCDTLISAINAPHLSWKEENGKKVPNYEKRLNRQFLPPSYLETGAFVISKRSVVTPETRIGHKVDVYEVSDEEAVDVDTFLDLQVVSNILSGPQKVAIYVNGNNKRGIGHIYRALEIADEFYVKPDIYYDKNQTDVKVFGKTTHNLKAVDGIAELFNICKEKQYNIFINDILTTSIDYMIGLRTVLPNAKIVNFEDDGEGIIKADLVFNALYHDSEFPQIHAGEKYYICGKTFMYYEPIVIRKEVQRVFIAFGGADPQNYSDRLLNIISKKEYEKYHFIVVLGRAKHNVDQLLEYNKFSHIKVLYDVSNMPELMSSCDIAITSRGRTGYELALLGIPSVAMAQNHREEKHGFVCNENGFSYIGLNPADEIIQATLNMYLNLSQESRKHYQDMLLCHDLKNGRKRVMALIQSIQ